MQQTALLAGEAVADAEIVTTVFKDATKRVRPAGFPADGNLYDSWFESRGSFLRGNGSFPSGHALAAFSVATVIARQYGSHRWIPYVAYGASFHAYRQLHGWIPPPQVIYAVSASVESRKGVGPGPTGSRWFPFPAHQTGRAQLEHPAFRLVSPQRPRKRSDITAPCDGAPDTSFALRQQLDEEPAEQACANDRSVALSPAHQKQGPFPPPTLLGLHGVGSEVARVRAGHRPPLKLYMQFSRIQLSRRLTLPRCNRRDQLN